MKKNENPRRHNWIGALLPLAAFPLMAGRALAAEPIPSPFLPLPAPAAALSGEGDATSVGTNPALLRWLTGPSLALQADYWSKQAARPTRGVGLFLSTPIFFGVSGGAGLSWRRPGIAGLATDYVALDLGLALRLGSRIGIGLGWDRLLHGRAWTRGSYTLGVDARLARWLAVGATVADLNRPRLSDDGDRLPRRFGLEAAFRPLTDRRWEVGLGATLSRVDRWRLGPRARIEGRVATGLRLFGELAWRRIPVSGGSAVGERLALAGLRFELDQADVAVAGMGRVDGDGGVFPGGSFLARVHANRRESILPGETIAQIKVDGLQSDRRFAELVLLLRRVTWDPNVAAVELRIGDARLGLGRIEELQDLLGALRARKKVVAYIEQATLANYYLASACDGILLDPAGSLFLGGLSHQVTYFKRALDALGVAVEVERIAEYKGAMEPFLFEGGSAPVKENNAALLDDEFSRLVATLAARRKLAPATVRTLIDKAVFSPTEAKAAGLVDALPEEEETEAVQRWFGRPIQVVQADTAPLVAPAWFSKYVAVIVADGAIVDGEGRDFPFEDDAMVWSDPLIETLEAVRTNPNVAAVVLRINSPGGSAVASDKIARAVARLRKAGKPVIASMGDVAASGGYYIAAPATRIFADPSTLTGSIGIYGYKADVSGLLGKLGLVVETMRRGEKADFFSLYRPWTPAERQSVAQRLRGMYERFLRTVEDGRKDRGLDQARVDRLGRGQVWTGNQAKQNALVDELAGLSQAIDEAARLGRVPRGMDGVPERILLPKPSTSLLGKLLHLPFARAAASLVLPMLVEGGSGLLARLPYDVRLN